MLPCVPGSTSDLLAATHAFQVEVSSLHERSWGPGPVGRQRFLELTLRLGDVYQGTRAIGKGVKGLLQ